MNFHKKLTALTTETFLLRKALD